MEAGKAHWALFLAVLLVFTLVEARGLSHIFPGDENVYYYMAKSMAQGQLPYRDFFYAHPPLHILVLAAAARVFGVNFFAFKLINLLALLAASFFLYKTALVLSKGYSGGKRAWLTPLLAVILFLFSFQVMFDATFSIGIAFAFMFMMSSFYFALTGRYFTSGLLGGLAGLTRLYVVVPVIAMLAFFFVRKLQEKRLGHFWRMLFGFFAVFGTAVIALAALFGNKFIEPVLSYHLLKLKLPNQRANVYKHIITENWVLVSLFLLSAFAANRKRFQLFFFVIITYLAFFLLLNVPNEFYFSLMFPFMAVIGAHNIIDLIMRIKPKALKYAAVALLAAVFVWNTGADIYFLEKVAFSEFDALKPLVDDISAASPQLKIFGDGSIVPLLGLVAGRSIALNYIDSDEMRFTSGLSNFYLFANQLDEVNLSYIVLVKGSGLYQIAQFRQYVQSRCTLEKEHYNFIFGYYLVYRCK